MLPLPPPPPLPLLLLLLLFLCCSLSPPALAQHCEDDSNSTDPKPTVCRLELRLSRQPDCSVLVTERIFLRTTVEGSFSRVLPLTTGQRVSGARHSRNNTPAALLVDDCTTDDNWRLRHSLRLTTLNSTSPVEHTLSYRLSSAVRDFTEPCNIPTGAKDYVNDSHNVLQVRVGEWPQSIQQVFVVYDSPGNILRTYGRGRKEGDIKNDTASSNFTIGSKEEAAGTINHDVYFIEVKPSSRCTQQIECLVATNGGGGGVSNVSAAVIVLIVIIVLAVIVAVFLFCRRRKSNATDVRFQQPIQPLDDAPPPPPRRRGPFGRRASNDAGSGAQSGNRNEGEPFPFGGDI